MLCTEDKAERRTPSQDLSLRLGLNPYSCAEWGGDGCGMGQQHKRSPVGLEHRVTSCIPPWPGVPKPFQIHLPLVRSLVPPHCRCGPASTELPVDGDLQTRVLPLLPAW